MMEEWKDIKGYLGEYRISSHGRVLSTKTNTILKQHLHTYLYVTLWHNGVKKNHSVHSLVAMAFCEGYEEGLVVNHKDENKQNNHAENLEWCTTYYNTHYGTLLERACKREKAIPVQQIDIETNKPIATYSSVKEAARITGIQRVNIRSVCRGIKGHYTAGGYYWKYIS